jgi:hypothetical protein
VLRSEVGTTICDDGAEKTAAKLAEAVVAEMVGA